MNTEQLQSTLFCALFQQHDRHYVPEWMDITSVQATVWIHAPERLEIKIGFHDRRGQYRDHETHEPITPEYHSAFWIPSQRALNLEAWIKLEILKAADSWSSYIHSRIQNGSAYMIPNLQNQANITT